MSIYFIANLSKEIKQKLSEKQTSRYLIIWRVFASCCLYGSFVYRILSYSFVSILYHCIYGCMFCMVLF